MKGTSSLKTTELLEIMQIAVVRDNRRADALGCPGEPTLERRRDHRGLGRPPGAMAEERKGSSFVPPKMYCVDNGSMIAVLGRLQLLYGEQTSFDESGIMQHLRTNDTPILWS